MKVIHIKNNFKEEVSNYKGISIVDFWAQWCGPCKMFGPIFETVSEKYEDIKFCKLNVDEDNEDISRQYGVMSIPTVILFKDGKEINRNIGFMDEDSLINFLENK
ncbi:MAG: thioredoxin [Bacilli bacterium]|nr:thioredoxin [Bacilli bacterium]